MAEEKEMSPLEKKVAEQIEVRHAPTRLLHYQCALKRIYKC